MKIEIMKAFTMRDGETGELVSYRKGAIVTVDDTLGSALINDGFAREDKRVIPTGTITITENASDIDVEQYAKADVDVPSSEPVEGTAYIRRNGTVNISQYAEADVEIVPVQVKFHFNGGTYGYQGVENVTSKVGVRGGDLDIYINRSDINPPQGKAFAGWCTTADGSGTFITGSMLYNVTNNIDLYAIYGDGVTVSMDKNGCTGTLRDRTGVIGYATVSITGVSDFLTPPAGKKVAGLGLTSDATEILTSPYTPISVNDTLYVICGDPAQVTFDNNGGHFEPFQDYTAVVGFNTVTNPNGNFIPPEGKYFVGWGLTDDATEPIQFPYSPNTASETLYAIYADEATVAFNVNGGKGTIADKKGAVGYATIVAPDDFEVIPPSEGPEDKILAGWGLTDDATEAEKVSFPYTPTASNVTLYAIYKDRWD